jgi:hypothetical protein
MLTQGQERLLRHLCRDVRLTISEFASEFLGLHEEGRSDSTRELSELVSRDLLRRDRVLARILPMFDAPLAAWRPGDLPPPMASVAWQSEKRWTIKPNVVTVYRAGPVARQLFGYSTAGGPGNLNALSHDIACCQLLVKFSRSAPNRARHWVSEDLRKSEQEQGEKLPDVILYDDQFCPYLVCEVTGVYPKLRLEAFHNFVADVLGLPYELW